MLFNQFINALIKRVGFALLIHTLSCLYAISQSSSLKFEQLANNSDLLLTHVSTITQDSLGYIWFGASNGLYRYDAYNFKPYFHDEANTHSISDNNINIVYIDNESMLWIGTRNGLNCYHQKTGVFQHFLLGVNDKAPDVQDVGVIKEDRFGNYWVGTLQGGLFLFSNKKRIKEDSLSFTITHFTHDSANASSISDNSINSILFDKNDNAWVATYGGLNRFKLSQNISPKLSFDHFAHDDKDTSSLYSNYPYNLYKDPKNRIWVVNLFGAVDLITTNGSKISFRHFFPLQTVTKDEASKTLLSIYVDVNDRAWIASKQFGLLLYDIKESNGDVTLTNLRRYANDKADPTSLTDNFVWRIFRDKNGLMWIGTYKGISKCNVYTEQFHAVKTDYDVLNLSKQALNCVYKKDGVTWLGSDHNVVWILNKNNAIEFSLTAKELTADENKENYPLTIFQSKKQNLYIGTARGLFVYRADEIRNALEKKFVKVLSLYPLLPIDNPAFTVQQIDSLIYIGAGNGLYKLNEENFNAVRIINEHQVAYAVRSIAADREKNIWLATEGGLMCYHPGSKKLDVYQHQLNDTSSISSSLTESVFIDNNNTIWTGTQFGLNQFISETKKFKRYHIKDGLPEEKIAGIVQDKNGNLWVSTIKGIAEFDPVKKSFRSFNEHDGLNAASYVQNCIFRADDGMILAGCDNGLNSFYPDSLYVNKQPPPVYITDLSIFSKSIFNRGFEKLKEAFTSGQKLVLNYQQNFFNISFVALNYLNTEKNQYAYKLEGINKDWVYCGNNRNANYTDISPGTYTFRVKAANNDGVWNEQGASIVITILPPWWKTWWFRTILVVSIIGLIFFSIKYYYKQKLKEQQLQFEKLKAVENIRVKISQDIHDEIGSSLTKISLMSQRIKLGYEKKKEVDPILIDKITESSKEVISNLGEIIWTVNPKHDNLQSLLAYLRNYITNFFEQTNIDCMIDFPEEVSALTISPDLKHNLFLVIKESLNNIIKHAEATEVKISFQFADNTYCFEITDNGKGTDLKGRDFGNGLINMKNRMKAVNGKFEIESEINKGTRIILKGEAG